MKRPNILFLMADQMQGRVLDPESVCQTPHMDRLAARGLTIERAYTPNAVCSPARASLMTGLLPHNHGVMWVHHCVDPDQGLLRTGNPHWAQRLQEQGYRTGYFGKWHVENTERPGDFGWEFDGSVQGDRYRNHPSPGTHPRAAEDFQTAWRLQNPGYKETVFFGVTTMAPEQRPMGKITRMASEWLAQDALAGDQPWCCFVSVPEPHDPFICGAQARRLYRPEEIPVPPNWNDELASRPGLYRKAAAIWRGMGLKEKREAAACYYASITEIDTVFGRLIEQVEAAGQLEDTIVILVSDHGEMLGAHGMYCKNLGAPEEVYHIPMVMAGPGIPAGRRSSARLGLHDLCPTLLELTGASPIPTTDSRSFAKVLEDPDHVEDWQEGYAEYHGGRYLVTQRVLWQGNWKYVHNGFDQDEMYNLETDPWEMENLCGRPDYEQRVQSLMKALWGYVARTGDTALLRSQYPILRLAPVGPGEL